MVKKMKNNFDKYWGSGNLLISIAASLDPRNKMKYIEWCADNAYSEVEGVELKVLVRETLRTLYDEYVEAYKSEIVGEISDHQVESQSSSCVTSTKTKGRKIRIIKLTCKVLTILMRLNLS